MSTEQKKTKNGQNDLSAKKSNKITPFRFPYDSSDDPEIENFILRNMQEEADEIERRMNEDPEFAQFAGTDEEIDQEYEKIVARLKEMGEWEEENEEETTGGDCTIYDLLSEEDRQALELGRREQHRQEKKKIRSARLLRFARRGGAVAAAFVLLFTVSMNVDASRRVILRMWDSVADVLVVRTATDNMEDSVESTMAQSLAAMAEIEEATGIPGLEFAYWPDGMEYLQYEIPDGNTDAYIFYSYCDSILNVYMRNAPEDSTNFYVTDQEAAFVESLENWAGTETRIWSVNPDSGVEQYQAEFEYETFRYVIYGYISLKELEGLIKGMDFLS